MNPYEQNNVPPAGGFGGGGSPQGWGPMPLPPPSPPPPTNKMARLALYLGIASVPGIFMCNALGLPLAVVAASLGIAALYQMRGKTEAPGRSQAIGGVVLGSLAVALLAALLAYFVFMVPGFR